MVSEPSVYLDYNATTPLAPEALEAMVPFLRAQYGNPSSLHAFGRRAKAAIVESREAVASFLSARPKEIVFTGGGTESDNLALMGVLDALEDDARRRVVASKVEHHAVLAPLKHLQKRGFEVTLVDVDSRGRLEPDALSEVLGPDVALVTTMLANNETGVIQDVEELARRTHEVGAIFHTDAIQACGKLPVDVRDLGVDLLSLSAHKFYGPKGVGALYVRRGTRFRPVFRGGGQERSRRPGTENVPGIVGLAEAARLATRHLAPEKERLEGLRDHLESAVLRSIPKSAVNGAGAPRTPNTVSFRFADVDGEDLMLRLDRAGFAVSTGAACSAGAVEPSHVLRSMGLSPEEVQGSIRVSLGLHTTAGDVESFAEALNREVTTLQSSKASAAVGAGAR